MQRLFIVAALLVAPVLAAAQTQYSAERARPAVTMGGSFSFFDAHKVDRLDPVGAFVDRGNARVPIVLRGAGLLDIAHAAMHLHAE